MASDQESNVRRLRALMAMFPSLTIQDVATVGKVSRPLVSGLLSGKPGIRANGLFGELERSLPTLVAVAGKRRNFFALDGVDVGQAEEAARSADGAAAAPSKAG